MGIKPAKKQFISAEVFCSVKGDQNNWLETQKTSKLLKIPFPVEWEAFSRLSKLQTWSFLISSKKEHGFHKKKKKKKKSYKFPQDKISVVTQPTNQI